LSRLTVAPVFAAAAAVVTVSLLIFWCGPERTASGN
jgi:hypothetical protein